MPRPYLAYMLSRGLLPAVMVKEYAWCPAIPWIIANKLVEPPATPSMKKGQVEHRSREVLEAVARRMGYKDPEIEKHLVDKTHGIYGVIDILAASEKEVVEVKTLVSRLGKHQLAQLKVYTLLAWSNGYRVRKAHLVTPRRKLKTLDVDQQLLKEARNLVDKTWRVVENPEPPLVEQAPEKCSYCRYRRLCPTRAY